MNANEPNASISRRLEETQRKLAAAERNEFQLRLVIDTIPIMAWILLADGSLDFVNHRWREYTGLTLEQAKEGPADPIHPDDRSEVVETWKKSNAGGESYESEMRLRSKSGEYRWFLVRTVPLKDERGQVRSWYGTSADIEDRKRAETALRETQAALARASRVTVVGELTSSIAHEVNQPLGAVVANADAALRWLDNNPPNLDEAREALRRIGRDGKRASEVVSRIRALLTGGQPAKMEFDPAETIREIVALTEAEARRRQIQIVTDFQQRLPRIVADRVQIQQVLANLIANALDATDEQASGPRIITISARESSSGGLVVSVEDKGVGVEAEQLPRLFEPFHTTKSEGLGLGLSISRSIIEAHGGEILAVPNQGPGLTIRFTLPCQSQL